MIPRYSGVRPDIRPTMKTVMMMYITMYIRPTPFPPGVDWISIPMNAARMTRACSPPREELTEPVVTAVVTTVQKAEKKPPNRVSIPGPSTVFGMNPITRSIAKRRYAPDEQRSRLALLAEDLPIDEAKGGRQEEHQEYLEDVGGRAGVLERVGGVGAVVPPSVGPQLHDGDERGDRPDPDDLGGPVHQPLDRGRVDVTADRLGDAQPDQDDRTPLGRGG